MSWVKLDDRFPENPKIDDLTDSAFRLHVTMLCRCARNETDGKIGDRAAKLLGTQKAIHELTEAGLWLPTVDGYEIKDYLKYNPSRAQLEAKRESTRERLKRYRDPECNAVTWDEDNDVTTGVRNAVTTPSPLPLSDLPPVSSHSQADPDQPESLSHAGGGASKPTRKKPMRPMPEGFAFADKHAAHAAKKGYPDWWARNRFGRFVELAAAKGWTYADWDRAFFNFLGGEIDYRRGPAELAHLAPTNAVATNPAAVARDQARIDADRAAQRARDRAEVEARGIAVTLPVKTLLGGIGNG
jgi:hypothetical protein